MKCPSCGFEIENGAAFCGNCGNHVVQEAAQQGAPNQQYVAPNQQQYNAPNAQQFSFSKFVNDKGVDSSVVIMHLGIAALYVLMLILWFVPSFSMYTATTTVAETLNNLGLVFVTILVVLVTLGGAALAALPIYKNEMFKNSKLLYVHVGVVAWIFHWFFAAFRVLGAFTGGIFGGGRSVSAGFTFGGILLLLASLGSLALSIIMILKNRKK